MRRTVGAVVATAGPAVLAVLLIAGAAPASASEDPALPASADVAAATRVPADCYAPTAAATTMRTNGWNWSTDADGLLAAYGTTGDERYRTALRTWARAGGWRLTSAPDEPDPNSLKAAQVHLGLGLLDPAVRLEAVPARLAADLAGQPDGLWRASLLDPALVPQPETSGSLSNCQGVGGDPQPASVGDAPAVPVASLHRRSPPFCVGAFLLAGAEPAALTRPVPRGAR